MKIYHGHAADSSLAKAREAAPSFDHRVMLSDFLTDRTDVNYALDNGAFVCWSRGEHWLLSGRAEKFVRQLHRSREKPVQPDFVVLPDVVMDAEQTTRRSELWATIIREEFGLDYPLYVAVQSGMDVEWALGFAETVDADGIFVGGDMDYKKRVTPELAETEYPIHVGRPGDLVWAHHVGVDSVDTTSIVQSGSWHRLRQLEEQTELVA